MRTLRNALIAVALMTGISPAIAQQFPTVQDHSVIGRIGAGSASGPSQAIPFATLLSQLIPAGSANRVFATPNGSSGVATLRALVGADLPTPGASSLGGVQSLSCASHNWFTALSTLGILSCSQPAFSDVSGQATFAQLPNVAADNLVGNPTGSGAAPTNFPLLNCTGALTYSTSTHTFGCNAAAGVGTVTSAQVAAGTGIAVSGTCTITTTGTCTVSTTNTPVLLNTLTASGSATIGDTTSLTATYSMYELVFENIIPATSGGQCELQVHSGGSFQATSYVGAFQNAIGTGAFAASAPTTFIACGSASQNNIGPGVNGRIRIHTPSSAAAPKMVTGETVGNSTTPSAIILLTGGYWNNSAAIDGFQVLMSAGNFSGVVKIYGYP